MRTAMAVVNCCSGAPPTMAAPMRSTASPPIGFGRCLRGRRKKRPASALTCVREKWNFDARCRNPEAVCDSALELLTKGLHKYLCDFGNLSSPRKLLLMRLWGVVRPPCWTKETFMKPAPARTQGISTCQTVLLWLLCTHLHSDLDIHYLGLSYSLTYEHRRDHPQFPAPAKHV